MAGSVQVHGTGQLLTLSRRLRAAGGARMQRNFARRIRRAAEPLHRDLQQAVRTMPLAAESRRSRQGGQSPTTRPFRRMLAEGVRLSVRTSGSPGARIWVDRSRLEPKARNVLNQTNSTGRLRHPVFGNRRRWANQRSSAGWWTRTVQAGTPRMTAEVSRIVDDVRRDLE
ncbi:hypothetical protein EES44_07770 [Streptomyces sp. ADI96-15]|uniref:hypothetical protein n=1 Tax=Streptomyces sp. ADI96-15 TaxID=1522761 RepID=UPI000F550EE9|nr:hypothetical protein [Streptomyces sp. ADI96-15]RPK69180.1 hypothetical protein EES44_07770 [Streptomyces sp. ADI96-15]